MVCFDTPTSRATSSALRPGSSCLSAPIICASLGLLFDMHSPFRNVKSYSVVCGFRGAGHPHWVFASPYKDVQVPYWALTDLVKPAATRAGITKRVGWHTFRHSYSTLLRANGTDVKVQSELLRHSNIGTTLNLYTQAVSDQKRAAHGQVVGQLLAV